MIIQNLLDTDFYKLTQQCMVLHQFPRANVVYAFKLRNYSKGTLLPFMESIRNEIDHLCKLHLNSHELRYLSSLPCFSRDYIEYLSRFELRRDQIKVYEDDGELQIEIRGPWLETILFETPVLAIVSEIFSAKVFYDEGNGNVRLRKERLYEKVEMIKDTDVKFVDFGTRRRFSRVWHEWEIQELIKRCPNNLIGTSNIDLARRYNLQPVGTEAHEKGQCCQVLCYNLRDSIKFSLTTWLNEYHGQLGIALTDTVGLDAFLRDFNYPFAKTYSGVRHDSGDPFEFGERMIKHYENLFIDPKEKMIVFSDGLDFPKMIELNDYFRGQIKVSFGIGTNLTNDVGIKAPQIVIKVIECNGQPVAKISDSPGKEMCRDQKYMDYVKSVFDIK